MPRRVTVRGIVAAGALMIAVFHGRAGALDLSAEAAGPLAASAQQLAQTIDAGWQATDRLLGPVVGPRGRILIARRVGILEQALGASREAGVAWRLVARLAADTDDIRMQLFALDRSVALSLAQGRYEIADSHATRMLDLARLHGSVGVQAAAESYLGIVSRRRGQLEDARRHQETALALRRSQSDRIGEAEALANLGTVYRDLGDFARALDLQLQALEIRRSLPPSDGLDISYRNVALLYREIEDTEQAKANFRAALAGARARHDPQTLASILGSYASFSNDIGESAAALTMARQALAIDASVGRRPYVGLEQVEIARALIALDRDAEAATEVAQALVIGREMRHREITGGALLQSGRLALRAGDRVLARKQLDEAIAILTEARLKPQLAEAFGAQEQLAQADGRLADALAFAHQRSELKQDLLGARSGRQLAALKSRAERAEADQRIRLLSLDNEVQSLRIRQQALMRNIGLGGIATLALLLLVLSSRYRTTRRLNRELQAKNAEITAHEIALTDANAKLSTHAAELYQAAITDPLTGAYNRGHVMRQLDEHVRRGATQPLSLLLIDFDHFKQVNDQHGHLFGDRVLATGVQVMRQWLEPGDLLGRYGGEEFVVVLPGRDTEAALATAERLRSRIAAALVALTGAPKPLTISIGVASLDQCVPRTLETILGSADLALYRAKSEGRNRVVRYAA